MMRNFKRVLAVVCSVSLMASSAITAFATAPTSTAGEANVLAYSLESVVVPSAIKVALNPQGLAVTTKGTGNDAVTSTAQIVSFNYGIANLSTADKDVKVTFNVTGTQDAEKTPITFVDDAAKATYGTADGAAKDGELKMYLAVVGSTAVPTTGEATPAAFAVTDKTGANDHNATAANLADVTMTKASGGASVFAKGDNYANADIAFKLGKTTYAVQDGETVDWTTTQAQLAEKMEPTTLGDVTGFTLTGTMNTGADWTTADVSSLTFTPVYEVTDVTGSEEAVTSGGYKQINVAAAAPATDDYTMTLNSGAYTYSFIAVPTGSLTAVKVDGVSKDKAITNNLVTYSNGVLTLTSTFVTNNSITHSSVVKVTIGETEYTMVIPE